jgi:hypothetical protein
MTNAELNAMPWTASLMTTDELFEWLANRREAARAIDIETAELIPTLKLTDRRRPNRGVR